MWESLEGGHASGALWVVMAIGLAAALIGWRLILASRKTSGRTARAKRLGYVPMVPGLVAFARGPDPFGLFSQ